MRAFVALEIEAAMQARIGALVSELRPSFPGLRWVRPGGIHLTLRFLGPSSPAQIERLEGDLSAAAGASAVTDAHVSGLGVFPEHGRPAVLWLGLDVDGRVLVLQAGCERAAAAAGFAPEPRAFRAHLTLGRWRDRVPRPTLPDVHLGRTRLEALVLFRSEPGPGGSVYTPLRKWRLGESAG